VFERVQRLVDQLEGEVRRLDPDCLDGGDAGRLAELFARSERLCATGKGLTARRFEDSNAWTRSGHRSAAEWLAATTGTTVGAAVGVLETARRLDALPAVDEAARRGQLSEIQAREITEAAAVDPTAARSLLKLAPVEGVKGLRDRCRQVKATAMSADEEQARYARIHRDRFVRRWTDADGAACGQWRTTPEVGARINAALDAEADRVFRAARADGRRERHEAYLADALVALADRAAGGAGSRAAKYRASLRVDVTALRGGTTGPGEVCEIAGVGPVPVAVAREVLGDALLDLVITDGVDVLNVTHLGRTRLASVRAALDWMFTECGVAGCHRARGLEHHHLVEYARTHHTRLDELVSLCSDDHDLVTHHGYQLVRRPDGQYDLVPPGGAAPDGDPRPERGPPVAA